MTAKPNTLELGPFTPGMNNRRPEQRMRTDKRTEKGDFLRSAFNADITTKGTVTRRDGFSLALAGNDCHSFWADGSDAFMVDGQSLKRIDGLPLATATTVRTGLMPGRPVSYARTALGVFYSNGIEIGRLRGATALGVATPTPAAPGVAVISGWLDKGTYGVCATYLDALGEESASTVPTWTEIVAENGGLTISGLPAAFPTGAASLVLYLTLPNDQTLQRALILSTPTASVTIQAKPALGARCQTLMLSPMPAGDIVRVQSGRLLVASGPVLYYSEPYMLGLRNPTRDYIQFPADITVVEVTSGGTWVCADQTYWFAGFNIEAADPNPVLPYGGVAGSGGEVRNSNDVYWMSPRGIVRATQTGEATNLQEEHVAVASTGFSAGCFRESDGLKQFIQSAFAEEPNRMAATSYIDAEVIRKGVTL